MGNPSTSEFKENKFGEKNGKDNDAKFKPKADDSQSKTSQMKKGCLICDRPHRAKDCPKCEALNAIVDDGRREGSNSKIIRVNPLELLNAICVEETIPTRTLAFSGGCGLL